MKRQLWLSLAAAVITIQATSTPSAIAQNAAPTADAHQPQHKPAHPAQAKAHHAAAQERRDRIAADKKAPRANARHELRRDHRAVKRASNHVDNIHDRVEARRDNREHNAGESKQTDRRMARMKTLRHEIEVRMAELKELEQAVRSHRNDRLEQRQSRATDSNFEPADRSESHRAKRVKSRLKDRTPQQAHRVKRAENAVRMKKHRQNTPPSSDGG